MNPASPADNLIIRTLGQQDYVPVWERMQAFTSTRDSDTADELWFLSHPPVFTQGQAGKAEHILNPGNIPVIQIDRGGQVTYHGPGQLVVYLLLDLRRLDYGIRVLVDLIEQSLIAALAELGISAETRAKAPGVYVNDAKIAALGLRVRKGCSYHGLSLNVDMDLTPFSRINPCGYSGMATTSISAELGRQGRKIDRLSQTVAGMLEAELSGRMGHTQLIRQKGFEQ